MPNCTNMVVVMCSLCKLLYILFRHDNKELWIWISMTKMKIKWHIQSYIIFLMWHVVSFKIVCQLTLSMYIKCSYLMKCVMELHIMLFHSACINFQSSVVKRGYGISCFSCVVLCRSLINLLFKWTPTTKAMIAH